MLRKYMVDSDTYLYTGTQRKDGLETGVAISAETTRCSVFVGGKLQDGCLLIGEIVEKIVEAGGPVEILDSILRKEVCERFKFDVNREGHKTGKPLLSLAYEKGHVEIAERLMKAGAKPDLESLFHSQKSPQMQILKKMFAYQNKLLENQRSINKFLQLKNEAEKGHVPYIAEAVKCYTAALEQEDASAQCNLGNMYRGGNGVPQSDEEAVKWYKAAAKQGYARAEYNLGWMYKYGRGVAQSDEEAVKLFTIAARRGVMPPLKSSKNKGVFL